MDTRKKLAIHSLAQILITFTKNLYPLQIYLIIYDSKNNITIKNQPHLTLFTHTRHVLSRSSHITSHTMLSHSHEPSIALTTQRHASNCNVSSATTTVLRLELLVVVNN